jgi:hypothetical protein
LRRVNGPSVTFWKRSVPSGEGRDQRTPLDRGSATLRAQRRAVRVARQSGRVTPPYWPVEDHRSMIRARSLLARARRSLPGCLALILPLVVAILAACTPGSGNGPGY